MTILKCDKCKKEIVDKDTDYTLILQSKTHNGYYVENQTTAKEAQICLDCYKTILNELL